MHLEILNVKDLKIEFNLSGHRKLHAVNGVSFSLNKGETLALVGESGSGKTTTALSLMKLLPDNGSIVEGEILYKNQSVINASAEKIRSLRWKEISIIFQGAMNALNPVLTIEKQLMDVIMHHDHLEENEARIRAEELLKMVEIDVTRLKQYPHQFSGGMRQRVMIAMALACNPKIVIGDEPTTALDVMVQAQIFDLLERLKKVLELSMIIITHDLSILGDTCDKVAVMYAGEIVEYGEVQDIYCHPKHPYTQKLLSSYPVIGGKKALPESIPGIPMDMTQIPVGCKFAPRCHKAMPICFEEAPIQKVENGHRYFCHLGGESL
ncbi:MAG: ABC transporter ATP-binding protein [Clostridia bacterium]|nr:ABC transporter ATP-binding protein [Clostridia bacterium]